MRGNSAAMRSPAPKDGRQQAQPSDEAEALLSPSDQTRKLSDLHEITDDGCSRSGT